MASSAHQYSAIVIPSLLVLLLIELLASSQLTRVAMHWSGVNAPGCFLLAILLTGLHKHVRSMQASLLEEIEDTDGYTLATAK